MLLKLIACNVFTREACIAVAESPHTIDLEFTEVGEHSAPDHLRANLQALITRAEHCGKRYDAILLLFGLCGNSTLDLRADTCPLVIPRAHDCCTILLGSRQTFSTYFKDHPSTPFSSVGYMERGEYFLRTMEDQSEESLEDPFAAYVEQYGEENARYIWDTLHPGAREESAKAYFIDVPETHAHADIDGFKKKVLERGLDFSILEGKLTLIRQLTQGEWNDDDFLVLKPGQRVSAVYDWDEILRAEPTSC